MTRRELEHIVKGGETQQVEFKRRVPDWEKLMREMIALTNTEGGYLLIGVDDNGDLVGVKDFREVEFEIEAAVKRHCRPWVAYEMEVIPITHRRTVVVITIPPSEKKPHVLVPKPGTKKGIAYYRVKDRSITASRELFHILRHRQRDKGVRFEFGEKEHKLMEYFESHDTITVDEFAKLVGISRWRASQTLIILVRANVIDIVPREREDQFVLK